MRTVFWSMKTKNDMLKTISVWFWPFVAWTTFLFFSKDKLGSKKQYEKRTYIYVNSWHLFSWYKYESVFRSGNNFPVIISLIFCIQEIASYVNPFTLENSSFIQTFFLYAFCWNASGVCPALSLLLLVLPVCSKGFCLLSCSRVLFYSTPCTSSLL